MICRSNQDTAYLHFRNSLKLTEVFQRGMIFLKIYKQRFKPCDHLADSFAV